MSKKFIAAIAISIFTGAFASPASAVITRSISHRSPAQDECIKENPQDHKGYLACVHAKKTWQQNPAAVPAHASAPAGSAPAAASTPAAGKAGEVQPVTNQYTPPADSSSPAAAKYQ